MTTDNLRRHQIKVYINSYKGISSETKRVCCALVDGSNNFTEAVRFTSVMDCVGMGILIMLSAKENAHLNSYLDSIHAGLYFSYRPGGYVNGKFKNKKGSHTIYLSCLRNDQGSRPITNDQAGF